MAKMTLEKFMRQGNNGVLSKDYDTDVHGADVQASVNDPGFLEYLRSKAAGNFESSLGGAMRFAGQIADTVAPNSDGSDGFLANNGKYLENLGRENLEMYKPQTQGYEDMDLVDRLRYGTIRDIGGDIAEGFGSSLLPTLTALVPGGLVTRGALAVASKLPMAAKIGTELANLATKYPKAFEMAQKAGSTLDNFSTRYGVLNGAFEAMGDAGSNIDEFKKQGMSNDEVTKNMVGLAFNEMPYLMAASKLQGKLFEGTGGLGPWKNSASMAKRGAANLAGVGAELGAEGYTEEAQSQLADKWTTGEDRGMTETSAWLYNMLTGNNITGPNQADDVAFAKGALGGLIGVPGGIYGTVRQPRDMNEPILPPEQSQDNTQPANNVDAQDNTAQDNTQPAEAPEAPQNTFTDWQVPTERLFDWDRNMQNDTLSGLTESKLRLLDDMYYNKFGSHLYVTSMTREGNGNSWHNSKQAFDVATDELENNAESRRWIEEASKQIGLHPYDEYENRSADWSGGHMHFSDHGEDLPAYGGQQDVQHYEAPDSYDFTGSYAGDNEIDNLINKYAEKYDIDPALIAGVMNAESSFNRNVGISSAGAIGLMQLTSGTASDLGVDPYDMEQNIEGGVKEIKRLLDTYNGDMELALAAYNAGEGNVNKYGGIPPFAETQNYVPKVMDYFNQHSKGKGKHGNKPANNPQITSDINLGDGYEDISAELNNAANMSGYDKIISDLLNSNPASSDIATAIDNASNDSIFNAANQVVNEASNAQQDTLANTVDEMYENGDAEGLRDFFKRMAPAITARNNQPSTQTDTQQDNQPIPRFPTNRNRMNFKDFKVDWEMRNTANNIMNGEEGENTASRPDVQADNIPSDNIQPSNLPPITPQENTVPNQPIAPQTPSANVINSGEKATKLMNLADSLGVNYDKAKLLNLLMQARNSQDMQDIDNFNDYLARELGKKGVDVDSILNAPTNIQQTPQDMQAPPQAEQPAPITIDTGMGDQQKIPSTQEVPTDTANDTNDTNNTEPQLTPEQQELENLRTEGRANLETAKNLGLPLDFNKIEKALNGNNKNNIKGANNVLKKYIHKNIEKTEFWNSLNDTEKDFMRDLDWFDDYGVAFNDVVDSLKKDNENLVGGIVKYMRDQMAQKGNEYGANVFAERELSDMGYTAQEAGNMSYERNYSNNDEWFLNLPSDIKTACQYLVKNGQRQEKEIPAGTSTKTANAITRNNQKVNEYFTDMAKSWLRDGGYRDNRSGQTYVVPEMSEMYKETEDAINGLEIIREKAEKYEGFRIPEKDRDSSKQSEKPVFSQEEQDLNKYSAKIYAKEVGKEILKQDKKGKLDGEALDMAVYEQTRQQTDNVEYSVNQNAPKDNSDVITKMIDKLSAVLGKPNVKVLNENDFIDMLDTLEKNKSRIQELRDGKNTAYGFAYGTKIYLNSDRINANTPAHEFGHIWAKVLQHENPDLWDRASDIIQSDERGRQIWNEVANDKEYSNLKPDSDAFVSEVLARIIGAENEKVVNGMKNANAKNNISFGIKLKKFLNDMIKTVCDAFGIKGDNVNNVTYDEFINAPIKAIWDKQSAKEFRQHLKNYRKANGKTNRKQSPKKSEMSAEDKEYMSLVEAYQNGDENALDGLREMVKNAAEKAGFTNAIPEQTPAYKTRVKPAPKKTVKVYKVFTLADDGSPTALFIGGTEKLPQGVWLDAISAYHFTAPNGLNYVPSTQNPYTKGGKTGVSVEIPNETVKQELIERGFLPANSKATKITALAYRPGWHAGTMPFFPQGGMKPPKGVKTNYENIHRYNQVVFECELAADKDYTSEAEAQPKARKKDGSLNSKKADLQYMPEDGFYYYATNPMTHGHPELGMWAISGSLKINRALSQEECDRILKENNLAPQEWEGGEMSLEKLGYTGEQNDAARKTLAPITYDSDGNVIPISQRFNPDKEGVEYSIEENKDENSIDNSEEKDNNNNIEFDGDTAIAQGVFDTYLSDGLKQVVREQVSKEIEENIHNFEELSDPVKMDRAFAKLPSVNALRTRFHTNLVKSNPAYQDRMAVRYEYARRCFLYDERIPNGIVRRVNNDQGQGSILETGTTGVPRGNQERAGENSYGMGNTVIPTQGEYKSIKLHFDKLIEDMQKKMETENNQVRHSADMQGASFNAELDELPKIPRNKQTVTEKLLSDFCDKFGIKLNIVDNKHDIGNRGLFIADGQIFLNRSANVPLRNIFWHEFTHWLKVENPSAYSAMENAVRDTITPTRIKRYRNEVAGGQFLSDEDVIEEMIADGVAKSNMRKQLMQAVIDSNPSRAKRILGNLWNMFYNLQDMFRTALNKSPNTALPQGLNGAEMKKLEGEIKRAMGQLVDKNGKSVFNNQNINDYVQKQSASDNSKLLAPNGKPSNLTKSQWQEVRTPAFKKWFGDWENDPANASKIVDENGEPLVVYHGTATDNLEVFNARKAQDKTGRMMALGLGKGKFYFIDNEFGAQSAANSARDRRQGKNPQVLSVYLNIKNPIYEDEYSKRFKDMTGKEIYNSYEAGYSMADRDKAIAKLDKQLLKEGYDGIIHESERKYGFGQIAVFNPNQIKSATENNGEFSTSDNNIKRSASNPNTNNNQSFIEKAKNLFNALLPFDSVSKVPDINNKVLTRKLEMLSGYRIKWGHMKGKKDDVILNTMAKVARCRRANDFHMLMKDKLANVILQNAGVDPKDITDKLSEAMSMYVLADMPDSSSAEYANYKNEYQQIENLISNNPEFAEKLNDVKDTFERWKDLTNSQQISNNFIDVSEEDRKTIRNRKYMYDQYVEELGPLERLVKDVEENSGSKLSTISNPLIAFRLFRGYYGKGITLTEGVGPGTVEGLKANFPRVNFKGFKTIHDILQEAGIERGKQSIDAFAEYLVAKHYLDIHARTEAAEKLLKPLEDMKVDLQSAKDQLKSLTVDKATYNAMTPTEKQNHHNKLKPINDNIEKLKKDITDYENQNAEKLATAHKYDYPANFSKEKCEEIIRKVEGPNGKPNYIQAQKDIVRYSHVLTDIMHDSGMINDEIAKRWTTAFPNYVPLHRSFHNLEEDDSFGDSTKHLEGSSADPINPLDTLIHNTYEFVKAAEKNKAKKKLAKMAMRSGVGDLIEVVDHANGKNTIPFMDGGKRKWLETTPDVVKCINNMGSKEVSHFAKCIAMATGLSRLMFTSVNPAFSARNFLRDAQDTALYSKAGYGNPFVGPFVQGNYMRKAFKHIWNKDSIYYEWLASGAAQASAISNDRNYAQQSRNKVLREFDYKHPIRSWKRMTAKEFMMKMFETTQALAEVSEGVNRIAVYERNKDMAAKLAAESGEKLNQSAAIIEAAFESRDTMDFARGGAASREWNRIVPFANVSIQSIDKLYRTYKRNPKVFISRVLTQAVIPSIGFFGLSMALGGDDDKDWWNELPNWQKETYHVMKIGDTIFRIPKGQDLATKYASHLTTQLLHWGFNNGEFKGSPYWKMAFDSLPSVFPLASKTALEVALGKSFFYERDIVPKSQQRLPGYLQYGPKTTETSKIISKLLNDMDIDISARKMDYAVQGVLGSPGIFVLDTIDFFGGSIFGKGFAHEWDKLDLSKENTPPLSSFFTSPNKASNSVNEFYDEWNEQQRRYNEWKETKVKPPQLDMAKYNRLKAINKQITNLNKREREIMMSDKYDAVMKNELLTGIAKKRKEFAKEGLQK